jgi:hypothetical protein
VGHAEGTQVVQCGTLLFLSSIAPDLLIVFGLDDLAPAIYAVQAHVVAPMHLAGRRIGRQRGWCKEIVRAVLAAPGSRFLVLLDSHRNTRRMVKRVILQRFDPF